MTTDIQKLPSLPNEILSVVIEQCSGDLPLLYKLLFVNWHFFNEAVRHIYRDPFALISLYNFDTRYFGIFQSRHMRLAQVMLTSVLSYSGEDPTEALRKHNLVLVNFPRTKEYMVGRYLSDFPDDRLSSIVDKDESSTNSANMVESPHPAKQGVKPNKIKPWASIVKKIARRLRTRTSDPVKVQIYPEITVLDLRKTLVNYSEYLWTLPLVRSWMPFIEHVRSVHLPLDLGEYMTEPIFPEAERLFLRFNAAHFRTLHLCVTVIPQMVEQGQHLEFKSLRNLTIRHGRELEGKSYYYTKDLQRFIREHQDAFPAKGPLDFRIVSGYRPGDTFDYDKLDSFDSKPDALLEYYLALKSPRRIEACLISQFYENPLLSEIDTSILRTFKDSMDRVALSEVRSVQFRKETLTAGMQAFLSRCSRLEELDLFVSDADLFRGDAYFEDEQDESQENTWGETTREASDRLVSSKTLAFLNLCSLRRLVLSRSCHYQMVVGVSNDAVRAFGSSLREVVINAGQFTPLTANTRFPSRESGDLPQSDRLSRRCNTLGDWNAPFLRSIKVRVIINTPSIQIGSLDGCPQLEELHLDVALRYEALLQSQPFAAPQDLEPYQEHESLESFKLFPKWTLPRLKTLELCTAAAIRFNFDSFEDGMPRLVSARFTVEDQCNTIIRDHAKRIPRLSKHFELDQCLELYMPVQTVDHDGWVRKWDLPNLVRLQMSGPCACVFTLDKLTGLPLLQELELVHTVYSSLAHSSNVLLDVHAQDDLDTLQSHRRIAGDLEADVRARLQRQPPLIGNSLQEVRITGRWIRDKNELVDLLTIYAPDIRRLVMVEPKNARFANGPAWILNSILRAAEIARSKEYVKHVGMAKKPTNPKTISYDLMLGHVVSKGSFPRDGPDDGVYADSHEKSKSRPGDSLEYCDIDSPFPSPIKKGSFQKGFRQMREHEDEEDHNCVAWINDSNVVMVRSLLVNEA